MTRLLRNPKNCSQIVEALLPATIFLVGVLILFGWGVDSAAEQQLKTEPSHSESGHLAPRAEEAPLRAAAASAKVLRYAKRIVAVHDVNKDGQLQRAEWATLKGTPAQIDTDGNAILTVDEFARHVARFAQPRHIRLLFPESSAAEEPPLLQPKSAPPQPPAAKPADAPTGPPSPEAPAGATSLAGAAASDGGAAVASKPAETAPPRRRDAKFFVPASRLPAGLPSWFHTQDKDGDGQISMAEYAESLNSSTLAEFNRYDRNSDGVITAAELVRRTSPQGSKGKDVAERPASHERQGTRERK